METRRRPRLLDVARLAGVSPATVSRAISQPDLLSGPTRERVQVAAESLGYVPDAAARALASGRSSMVGAVVPTLENAVFARMIHRLQLGLADGGLQLVVAAHQYDDRLEAGAIRSLLSHGIDALILVGSERPDDTWKLLSTGDTPVLITYTFHPDFTSIGFDNERAGYLAAHHLVELGHRQIGFISGPRRGNDRMAGRIAGVARALNEVGGQFPPTMISEQEFSLSGGKLGTHVLMSLGTPPTAIIGGNDMIAAGALHELSIRGYRVPQDVSVVGIENLDVTTFTTPALTSVQLPTAEIGEATARHVLAVLRDHGAPRRVEFEVGLVERSSTAPPA
jgi:LacI family transcriptional regulator